MKHPLCSGNPKYEINYGRDNLWVDRISLKWMHDEKFRLAYDNACEDYTAIYGAPQYEWRIHVLIGLAFACSKLFPQSCFVDLGVHEANYAMSIYNYFNGLPVLHHYLYDSFEGLLPSSNSFELKTVGSSYSDPAIYERVLAKFADKNQYSIIKGWLPESLEHHCPRYPISLLNVDLNSAYPEIESIKYLWNTVIHGGYVLLDDYGRNPLQRDAIDLFCVEYDQFPITLPTGQGLIIKA